MVWGPLGHRTLEGQSIQELTYLAGCTTVSWGTDTGPSLWVAPLSRTTLAYLGAVDTKHSWWAAWIEPRGQVGVTEPANCSPLLDKGCGVLRDLALHPYLPSSKVQSSLGCRHSSRPGGGRSLHDDTGRLGSI